MFSVRTQENRIDRLYDSGLGGNCHVKRGGGLGNRVFAIVCPARGLAVLVGQTLPGGVWSGVLHAKA